MYGYKGFDKNFCCRGFQYEVGKTYELEGELEICKNGFHFCTDPNDVTIYYPIESYFLVRDPIDHNYYPIESYFLVRDPIDHSSTTTYKTPTENRYAVVEALGEIVKSDTYDSKYATNKIRIVGEISQYDYLELCCKALKAEKTRARL